MKSLIKKIQNFSGRYDLWKKGDKIIVGVSGGADSVCLLDILVKLASKYNFKLHIVHVNYGLRGKDSDRDEEFVKKLAKKYGLGVEVLDVAKNKVYENIEAFKIPLTPFSKGGANLKEEVKLGNENRLREIRYDFFEKIRKRKKYNLVAVAHNQDDQVETVLMRILRGAGLRGLRAMLPKNTPSVLQTFPPQRGREEKNTPPQPPPLQGEKVKRYSRRKGDDSLVIRPLLNTSRKEILEYLKENKLKYQTDITNKDIKFLRNKIRHKLIPYLEKNYNPDIKKTLANMAVIIADDYDYLSANKELLVKRIGANANKKDKILFSAEKFQKLHPAIQRQYLRQVIFQIKSDLTDIENSHIEEIIKIIKSKKSKIQTIKFKGLKIEKKGDKVIVLLA